MEQVTEQQTTQATPVPGQVAEGVETQETVTTEQKPAPEVTQEKKPEGEEQHRSRAYRRLDRWRTRAIEAEARLKATQELQQQRQPVEPKGEDPEAPVREQFESYEEFNRAEARYVAKAAAREEAKLIRQEQEQARTKDDREKQAKEWGSKIEKARDEVDDFDEVTSESEAIVTGAMQAAIMESDKGPHIAYFLAKNPAEAERISKLSNSKQAAAIVALEDKVSQPAKQPSKAPEPITPVGQKSEVQKDPASMSDAEFAKWRKNQIAQRR